MSQDQRDMCMNSKGNLTQEALDEVWAFWFEEIPNEDWFKKDDDLDLQIQTRFGHLIPEALAMSTNETLASSKTMCAVILLLDQFPRNIYRKSAEAFAHDARALELARKAVATGLDLELSQTARPFVYLPFMHSENIDDQRKCIELCRERLPDSGGSTLKFAKIHLNIIEKFNRFPHRNKVLGRTTTPAEQKFLNEGGFGG